MSRRKYEQGGGVVPTEWKRGNPEGEWGVVIVETWALSFDWNGDVQVGARTHVWKWSSADGCWLTLDGTIPPVGRKVRRWMRVGNSVTASIPLTLENWPHA